MKFLSCLIFLLLSVSCGKSNSRAGFPIEDYTPLYDATEGVSLDKLYLVRFSPIPQPGTPSLLTGTGVITLNKGKVFADIELKNVSPHTRFIHNVYRGNRCPLLEDDANLDGHIDAMEMRAITGPVFYPLLVNDLGETSDGIGDYTFTMEESYDKTIGFEGNVVMILGAPDTADLPESVRGRWDRLPHEVLPVACGILKRVTEIPEESSEPVPSETQPERGDAREEGNPSESDEDRSWYERVIDWWRSVWGD